MEAKIGQMVLEAEIGQFGQLLGKVTLMNDHLITEKMELSGFEPLAFSMPLRRATNCAIAPYAFTMMPRSGQFVN